MKTPAKTGELDSITKVARTREILAWLLFWRTFWVIAVAAGVLAALCATHWQRVEGWAQGAPQFSRLLIHSQTFWIGLGAIGTVLTLCFIYKQVAAARNVNAYQFLRELDERYHSPEMRRRRSNLARVLLTNPRNYDLVDQRAGEICDYFEDLGLLLRKRIVPQYLAWTMFDYRILRYWPWLSRCYIPEYRRRKGDETYYSEFEYLWKRIARFEKNARKRNKVDVDQAGLDEFLRDELRLQVRRFTMSDLGRVMEIERSSFDVDAYSEYQFYRLHRNFPGGFRVAEISNFVVGYVAATAGGESGEIDSMAVDPDYRRLGIGRKLLESALTEYLHNELRVQVRRFTMSDLGRVMEIERASFDVDAYSEDQFQALYRDFPGGFRVAEISNFVVGYVAATAGGETGEIDSMAVDPDYRRLGIGHQLLELAMGYFKAQHPELRSYRLQVRTDNKYAIHLYEQLGFEPVGTLKKYYKDGADAFQMEKRVTHPGTG
ncbi:MAG: GNAT family N-acetyltransferase [Terriglobia bacterium]